MTLPDPHLDTRSFADLIAEARTRIPRYTPEWTNFNDSDPGMTLVKLHAWMTETILHELDRVPELNYLKFLRLLGIHLRPAYPARAELAFVPGKLPRVADPLTVPVPLGTAVAVEDPDLPAEVVFETERTLLALNARIAALLVPSAVPEHQHLLVTRYADDVQWLPGFTAFIPESTVPLYLGLLLRPVLERGQQQSAYAMDRWPAGPLDVYANAVQADDPVQGEPNAAGRAEHACPPPGTRPGTGHLRWELYTGGVTGAEDFDAANSNGWQRIVPSLDAAADFSRSGHLVLELPAGATALNPLLLPRQLWDSMGAVRPPRELDDLLEALDEPGVLPGLADQWERLGVTDPDDLLALAACGESVSETQAKLRSLPAGTVDPTALDYAQWVQVSPVFAASLPIAGTELRDLYWLRARPARAYAIGDAPPVPLASLHLNTVPALQAATRLEDSLGSTTGRPGQQVAVPRTPILVDASSGLPDLELELASANERRGWQLRADFAESGPEDRHAVLDAGSGVLTFGDGRYGVVPEAGLQILAARYRAGGGSVGNVPAGTITRIKGRIRNIEAVSNLRAARGGSDAESLEQLVHRAPQLLRIGGMAHTGQDFAELALRTPGQSFHSAYTLPRKVPGHPPQHPEGSFVEKDGAVTVVVLPHSPVPDPQPDAEQLRALCAWLEPYRLVTTELHLAGPSYTRVTKLGARIGVRPGYDLSAVVESLYTALLDFLHPLRGGPQHTGWPFGYDILHGDLYEVMLAVPGVHRVRELAIEVAGPVPEPPDVGPLARGDPPLLERSAL